MLASLKYFMATLVVVALFALARGDLANIRMLAADATFFTTQIAELTRLEKEMLRFRVNAAAIVHGEEGITRDDMLLSFDILWSRVNTENNRFINPRIDAIRNYRGDLNLLAARLQRIDALVQNLAAGAEDDLRKIETELQASAPAVTQMTDDAYAELYSRAVNATEMQRAALKSVDHMQWLFLVSGFAVILLLAYQLRRSEKLYIELQSRESEIRSLAAIDPLTGLNNRRHFDERMKAIDQGLWTGNLHMLVVDLDGFKQVNDRNGHEAGDHLLRVIARRLPATAGNDALIARLGGDEFALVVRGDAESAKRTAAAVIREVSAPVIHDGATLQVGASVGIASLKSVAMASSMMLREADAALYQAKANGRGQAHHFAGGRPFVAPGSVQSAA
jgi:diguanylate cyclase (GGDEF)-like protein